MKMEREPRAFFCCCRSPEAAAAVPAAAAAVGTGPSEKCDVEEQKKESPNF